MGIKRALIVDDSKSARVFLSRILEKYEIDVDMAENAEAAIEYLGGHRPDVIFMDHMMPGMDGFQAVQAIKNNPRTATIPIMMYTSQEGELYLGQARALGAVGVLPKQIKPADVSKVLYQLHLVQDRRNGEQTSFKQVTLEAVETPTTDGTVPPPPISKPLTDTALRDLFADLRRALVASIDTQSERITSDVRMLIQDAQLGANQSAGASREGRAGWVVAVLALVVALGSAGLWWREAALRQDLVIQLAELKNNVAAEPRVAATAVLPEWRFYGRPAGGCAMAERRRGWRRALPPPSVVRSDDGKPIATTLFPTARTRWPVRGSSGCARRSRASPLATTPVWWRCALSRAVSVSSVMPRKAIRSRRMRWRSPAVTL